MRVHQWPVCIESRVLSWPAMPRLAVEVNTEAGLLARPNRRATGSMPSNKILSDAAILPKREGCHSTRALHGAIIFRAYTRPVQAPAGWLRGLSCRELATVRRRACVRFLMPSRSAGHVPVAT